MCDYSLEYVASRPAKIEDKLVTSRFPGSVTRGFSAVGEPDVAVCLLPGTEIAFENDVEIEHTFGSRHLGQRVARFRQVNLHERHHHHDALEFPDGQIVLLTQLCRGQRATVLQLPATARASESRQTEQEVALDAAS